jgi:Zn-dependent peptidase ImmA (M78 family)
MNLALYKPSHLENWITEKYIELGIMSPGDLEPHNIATKLNVDLYKHPVASFSIREGGVNYIFLKDSDPYNERVQFFHELCHLLRHSGNQLGIMPQTFRELQERDANHFTQYAAMPLHMLTDFKFESPDIIYELSEIFCVPISFAAYRLENIKRKLRQETLDQIFIKNLNSHAVTPYPKYRKFNLDDCSNETKRLLAQLNQQLKGG